MKTLILSGFAIALLALGLVRVELVAQPRREPDSKSANVATGNAERTAKLKAMVDAAQATYDGVLEDHNLGRATLNNEVYVWSSNIRSAQVRAADSRQQVTKACKEHLDRMQSLHYRVASLGKEGVPGGEMHKQSATQFYVAEAELLLMEAKGDDNPSNTPPIPDGR